MQSPYHDGPDFDTAKCSLRDFRRQLDGFVQIFAFEDIKAAKLLFGLGKWAVGGHGLAIAQANGGCRIDPLQWLTTSIDTPLGHVAGEDVVPLKDCALLFLSHLIIDFLATID